MSNKNALNLDEVLGSKTMKVRFQGKEYPIRTLDSLSPNEFGRVMAYGQKFSTLTVEEMQVNGEEAILKGIDEVIEIIGPDLPRYQPTLKERFMALLGKQYIRKFALSGEDCIAIMKFWTENNPKKAVRAVTLKKKRH